MTASRVALLLVAASACAPSDRTAVAERTLAEQLCVDPAGFELREVDQFETDRAVGGVAWDGERLWLAYHRPTEYGNLDPVSLVALDAAHREVVRLPLADDYTPPRGLAWRDGKLWLNRGDIVGNRNLLLELDPATGEQLRSFATDLGSMDLAFDGHFLLIANLWGIVQRIDPDTGWLDAELRTPFPLDEGYMRGVAQRPGEIWLSGGSFEDYLTIMDEEGHHLGSAPIDVAWNRTDGIEDELFLTFAGDQLVLATNDAVHFFEIVTPEG